MNNLAFVGSLALMLGLLFGWSFRVLPRERWQILAVVPLAKDGDEWQGLNLTYYGFFMATATAFATAVFGLMLAALKIPLPAMLAMAAPVLGICFPAAKLIARLVEGKPNTLTVGGAAFVGFMLCPAVIWAVARIWGPLPDSGRPIPLIPVMAAIAVAYCFGEGLGRLACISFGCCYGKPVSACRPLGKRLFGRWNFRFSGATKKVAYEGDLEQQPVVPIQAISAVVLSTLGLAGLWLFLTGGFKVAMILCLTGSQLWRFFSEYLRADYRGNGKFSAYQLMSLLIAVLALLAAPLLPNDQGLSVSLANGIAQLWRPLPLLALQAVWVGVFLFSGRSGVTGAKLKLFVHGHEH